MGEFWETAFQDKQKMWGDKPIALAEEVAEIYEQQGFRTILIPGFGYGRNARPFYEKGFDVTGIEISTTAIKIAHKIWGQDIRVFNSSVDDMPFDENHYDGVFCHALIHLLDATQRHKFIRDCYQQLQQGGLMCITAITKAASTYGVGEELSTDRYRTKHGVNLYFYDEESIELEFKDFGLIEAIKINEGDEGKPITEFWKIVCKRTD